MERKTEMEKEATHDDAVLISNSGLTTERIQGLSDGVFSIAMTILVLELTIPSGLSSGQLAGSIYHLWPRIAAYFLSFLALGTLWIGQHLEFNWVRTSNRTFLWLSLVFLAFVALVPFSTTMLGEYPSDQLTVVFYAANLTICAALLLVQWLYATQGHRLVSASLDHELIDWVKFRVFGAICLNSLAMILTLWSTTASLALLGIGQILAIVPFKREKNMF